MKGNVKWKGINCGYKIWAMVLNVSANEIKDGDIPGERTRAMLRFVTSPAIVQGITADQVFVSGRAAETKEHI